jgi:hypothetical protein
MGLGEVEDLTELKEVATVWVVEIGGEQVEIPEHGLELIQESQLSESTRD